MKLNAEKAPFFVEKLAVSRLASEIYSWSEIRTLPCVVVFIDGVAKGRQVGFEGLGGDEFATVGPSMAIVWGENEAQLAWKLKEWEGIEEDVDPEEEL